MKAESKPHRERRLTVIAQDPSVLGSDNKVLLSQIYIPAEEFRDGPWGYRIHVADYNATLDKSYQRAQLDYDSDPLAADDMVDLIGDPRLHAINAYGLVMRTLSLFERALGRRVKWGFGGHQLNVVPHAFNEPNAFYSRENRALLFGYFPSIDDPTKIVFTSLSHDVVVHETTHAILDGLRPHFMVPSSADQAAFHEGFADVVALLSVFSLSGVAEAVLRQALGSSANSVKPKGLTKEQLKDNGLLKLAEQFGKEGLRSIRGDALRQSVKLPPSRSYYQGNSSKWLKPHRRGEILVAAVMNAFIDAWFLQIKGLTSTVQVPLTVVAAEGARIADLLLTMVMRAIDYTPPVHLTFPDFLSALLTVDRELWSYNDDDVSSFGKYSLRYHLRNNFGRYGINPVTDPKTGYWLSPTVEVSYGRNRFEQMRAEPDEVFRFIWENRTALRLNERASCQVVSVRPVVRVGSDGFVLREVVVEYLETLILRAGDLGTVVHPGAEGSIVKPEGMPDDLELELHGGGTLIFDDFGQLKYHISNGVGNPTLQSDRLAHLWKIGYSFERGIPILDFGALHRARAIGAGGNEKEVW